MDVADSIEGENEAVDSQMEKEVVEEASDVYLQIVDDVRKCIICKDLCEKQITTDTAKQLKLFHDDGLN